MIKVPVYSFPPISRKASLANLLSTNEEELIQISDNVELYWKPGKSIQKSDGTIRITNDAKYCLKIIQERIKNRILKEVKFPRYLHGGIADKNVPRSIYSNAKEHLGSKVLICEDIKSFFPSTSSLNVNQVWQYFFNFEPEIAKILTSLTTYKNQLPQGWKTSGYIANLVFWNNEYKLVKLMESNGFKYTRFVDDIIVSSYRNISVVDKGLIIKSIVNMLAEKGYKLKRPKHQIATRNSQMFINGLLINSGKISIPRKERKAIRTQVFVLEQEFSINKKTEKYKNKWNSVLGKVARMSVNQNAGYKSLKARLDAIKPEN
ncbi:MAG: reverse transcriptase family protein [Marinicella sp.]